MIHHLGNIAQAPQQAKPKGEIMKYCISQLAMCLLVACFIVTPVSAEGTPDDSDLVLAGLAMAPPTYLLGVATHEGSHAIAAKIIGLEVTDFKVLPGWHPETGAFYFGFTRVRGHMTKGEETFLNLAPKITNAIMLGSYALALNYDAMPENRYGRLAFAVLATGAWVDFSKDIFSPWRRNDMNVTYELWGADTFWKQLPWYLLHAGLSTIAFVTILDGYESAFKHDEPSNLNSAIAPILWINF